MVQRQLGGDGAQHPAMNRDEMRDKCDGDAGAGGNAQLLLYLAEVTVLRYAVGAQVLLNLAEEQDDIRLLARAAGTAEAVDYDGVRINDSSTKSGHQRKQNARGITAGTR